MAKGYTKGKGGGSGGGGKGESVLASTNTTTDGLGRDGAAELTRIASTLNPNNKFAGEVLAFEKARIVNETRSKDYRLAARLAQERMSDKNRTNAERAAAGVAYNNVITEIKRLSQDARAIERDLSRRRTKYQDAEW